MIRRLKKIYEAALSEINSKILVLSIRESEAGENTLQSVIYQKQYQQALRVQIGGILDKMNGEQFDTIADYLANAYEDGFFDALYSLHKQDIPLIFPIDQEQAAIAVQTDSKISEGLYKRLGEDVAALKKTITNSVTRGGARNGSGRPDAEAALLVSPLTSRSTIAMMRLAATSSMFWPSMTLRLKAIVRPTLLFGMKNSTMDLWKK